VTKKAIPGIGYGSKGWMLMVFSPSLRRHYPDQVPRVVPDQDSQPHGSPGYVETYNTAEKALKSTGFYPENTPTTALTMVES